MLFSVAEVYLMDPMVDTSEVLFNKCIGTTYVLRNLLVDIA